MYNNKDQQSEFAHVFAQNSRVVRSLLDKDIEYLCILTINQMVQNQMATNAPSNPSITYLPANFKSEDTQLLFDLQAPNSILLLMLAETHNDDFDIERGKSYILQMEKNNLSPTAIVLERGMDYVDMFTKINRYSIEIDEYDVTTEKYSHSTTTYEWGKLLSIGIPRSMVIAAYLAVCFGRGAQTDTDNIILFFGARHVDIWDYFNYFIEKSNASYLQGRERSFYVVKSHT
jgi:hypothetical protein